MQCIAQPKLCRLQVWLPLSWVIENVYTRRLTNNGLLFLNAKSSKLYAYISFSGDSGERVHGRNNTRDVYSFRQCTTEKWYPTKHCYTVTRQFQ